MVLDAFVDCLNDNGSHEVQFANLRCRQRSESEGADERDPSSGESFEVSASFSLEGVEEVGTLSVDLDASAFEILLVTTRPGGSGSA